MQLTLETELLYELALRIGESADLGPMLNQFCGEMLRLVNGSGVAVCRVVESEENHWHESVVMALPRNLYDDPDYRAFKRLWRPVTLYAALAAQQELHPIVFEGEQALGYAFGLREFGILVLLRKKAQEPLSDSFLRGLIPLMQKLAGAARACMAKEQLVLERQRLRLATRSAGIGVWEWDVGRDRLLWDHQMLELHGLNSDEFGGSLDDWGRRMLPEDQVRITLTLLDAVEQEQHFVMEFRILRGGVVCHLRGHGEVLRNMHREPVRVIGVMSDITARKTMERDLRERVESESLVASLSARFVSVDIAGLDNEIEAALGVLGLLIRVDRSYVMLLNTEQSVAHCTHEWRASLRSPDQPSLDRISRQESPWLFARMQSRQMVTLNGMDGLPDTAVEERRWLGKLRIASMLAVPLWSGDTQLGMMILDNARERRDWTKEQIRLLRVAGDIMANALERQRKYQQLERSEARHRGLVAAIPDHIFRLSPDGQILDYISSEDGSLAPENVLGQSLGVFLSPEVRAVAFEKISHALEEGAVQILECEWGNHGAGSNVEIRMTPASGGEAIAIVRNIDERARLERMRNEFINDASHELRTPLTTITMMVDLLENSEDDIATVQQYWRVLKAELDRAHLLIEDLLAWGRLESGRLGIAVQPQDLREIVAQACEAVRPMAENKSVRIEVQFSDSVPEVMGNHYALLQVFVNLLNNAVKFTPEAGRVRVTLAEEGECVLAEIEDTGIGIPEDDLSQLFGRFFRASNAIAQDIPGSGMGLALVRGILEELRGHIEVSSELNRGTTFSVSLPGARIS